MINKVVGSPEEAIRDITDGAKILVGGFGFCGVPENLLHALSEHDARNLTTASDDCGLDGWGLGLVLAAGRIRRMLLGRAVHNKEFDRRFRANEIEVEFNPLGTLVERLRAGAAGIPAFYTPTGVGTLVAEGKETREFDGRTYLLERAVVGDYALIAAWRGDRMGNLIYRGSARNTNPLMASAAKICIAEVEELVEVGTIEPENVHTPGIYVHRVVVADRTKGSGHPESPWHGQ
jgi:3-oxoacid CoA-transferase subunit A